MKNIILANLPVKMKRKGGSEEKKKSLPAWKRGAMMEGQMFQKKEQQNVKTRERLTCHHKSDSYRLNLYYYLGLHEESGVSR